jgi:hypothetical protein
MKLMKKLSKNAKDLYSCLCKGVKVGGNKTEVIQELLDAKLISEIKKGKDKGKFEISLKSKN